MPLLKPKSGLKTAVLVPAYKRPEYTEKCLTALKAAQDYGAIITHPGDQGLRNAMIDFFEYAKTNDIDIIAKMDNDCVVPENWLNDIIDIFEKEDVDILSPNVYPSNAAFRYGEKVPGLPYMPAKIIGGLWVMRADLISDLVFTRYEVSGIKGAIPLLRQIVIEKNASLGWVPQVEVEDIGHWSGLHPECIKTAEHQSYSQEVGREIAWHS